MGCGAKRLNGAVLAAPPHAMADGPSKGRACADLLRIVFGGAAHLNID